MILFPLQGLLPPVVAAVAGALLGAVLTLLTQLYLRRRRKNATKRNLRLAFGAELSDLGNALRFAAEDDLTRPETKAFLAALPTKVYDTRVGDVGLLTEGELTSIIEFYDSLTAAGAISEAEIAHGFDEEEFELEYTPDDLLVRHEAAVEALTEHLSDTDIENLGLETDRESDEESQPPETESGAGDKDPETETA